MSEHDFSGMWHSVYRYTSSTRPGEFESVYDVKLYRDGNQLVMESLPNEEGSYVLMRLSLDGRIATGTWQETTSPNGHYKGVICHGALQLVLDEAGDGFYGKWVGFDRRMEVRSGSWEVTRATPRRGEVRGQQVAAKT